MGTGRVFIFLSAVYFQIGAVYLRRASIGGSWVKEEYSLRYSKILWCFKFFSTFSRKVYFGLFAAPEMWQQQLSICRNYAHTEQWGTHNTGPVPVLAVSPGCRSGWWMDFNLILFSSDTRYCSHIYRFKTDETLLHTSLKIGQLTAPRFSAD